MATNSHVHPPPTGPYPGREGTTINPLPPGRSPDASSSSRTSSTPLAVRPRHPANFTHAVGGCPCDSRHGVTELSTVVREATDVLYDDILDLLTGVILVLRIALWTPRDACARIAARILASGTVRPYAVEPGFLYDGEALFDSNGDRARRERYHARADEITRHVRSLALPDLSGVDHFRLRMEELHPAGTRLERLDCRPLAAGIARVVRVHGAALAHLDRLSDDAPEACSPLELITQVSMNSYVEVPETGGELVVWPVTYTPDAYETRRAPWSYALEERQLPPPAAVMKPDTGDLILFNANAVHAVRPPDGTRVTCGLFMGYRGAELPLSFWS